MLHLNIRSIPDHFLQLTSLLNNWNTELKIVAISETWIKPFHINYNSPNYYIEQDFCFQNEALGSVYISIVLYNINYEEMIKNYGFTPN